MSDCEDTVFVECTDDARDERDEGEGSVEVLRRDSGAEVNMRGEREDIMEVCAIIAAM